MAVAFKVFTTEDYQIGLEFGPPNDPEHTLVMKTDLPGAMELTSMLFRAVTEVFRAATTESQSEEPEEPGPRIMLPGEM